MECSDKTYAECMLSKFKKSLNQRPKDSYNQRQIVKRNEACQGNQNLNKISFLSMIGARKYTQPELNFVTLEQERLEILQQALNENNSNVADAAASLGIPPSVFKKRYNILSSVVNSTTIKDEPASPTPERRYFENLATPWKISSFNTEKREVCIEIQSKALTTHLSSTIPNYS